MHVQVPAVKPVTLTVPSPAGLPGDQSYVYPPAPPVGVLILAAPFEPPKHDTFVCDDDVTDNAKVGEAMLHDKEPLPHPVTIQPVVGG